MDKARIYYVRIFANVPYIRVCGGIIGNVALWCGRFITAQHKSKGNNGGFQRISSARYSGRPQIVGGSA